MVFGSASSGTEQSMRVTFQPPPHLVLTLTGTSAGRTARTAVKQLLAASSPVGWHADAELVVSELVANAVTECGECRLSGWYAVKEQVLRVEVRDASSNMPVPQPFDNLRIGGHGLRIVESLSTRWGIVADSAGKSVWIEIDG